MKSARYPEEQIAFCVAAGRLEDPGADVCQQRANLLEDATFAMLRLSYRFLHAIGGFALYGSRQDHERTPPSARYAFISWAFPPRGLGEQSKGLLGIQ